MPGGMSNFVCNYVVGFPVQRPNIRGHLAAAAWSERRLQGPAAPTPRRTPHFRALSAVVAAHGFLGGDDVGFSLGGFSLGGYDVEMIGGVWAVAAQAQVLRLSDGGVDLKYGVVMRNLTDRPHPGIYGSNCPLPPSPNTRLFRDCQLLMPAKGPAPRYFLYH